MDENLRATDELVAEGPLLFGRVLDGEGGARPIGWKAAQRWHRGLGRDVLWLHFDRTAAGVQEWRVRVDTGQGLFTHEEAERIQPQAHLELDAHAMAVLVEGRDG